MTIERVKRLWKVLGFTVLGALFALFLLPRLFGYVPVGVLSDSLEHSYSSGSLIYVKETKAEALVVGSPATYYRGDLRRVLVTRRVVEVDEANQLFFTQGDDPNGRVEKVRFPRLLGVPGAFQIPLIGRLYAEAMTLPGFLVLAAIVGIYLILGYFFSALAGSALPHPARPAKAG